MKNREIRLQDDPDFQYHPVQYCMAVWHENLQVVSFYTSKN